MELLGEILLEVYGELMFLIIPEIRVNKKYAVITKIIAALVFIGVIALAFWGAALVMDDNPIGILPISIAAFVSLAQIIAGILLYKKNHSK